MSKMKITQVRSLIGVPEAQKRVVQSLGLGRIGKSREVVVNAATTGMVNKVQHLIKVEQF